MYKNPSDSKVRNRKSIKGKFAPNITITDSVRNSKLEKIRKLLKADFFEFNDMALVF